jgi:hypothetical protein
LTVRLKVLRGVLSVHLLPRTSHLESFELGHWSLSANSWFAPKEGKQSWMGGGYAEGTFLDVEGKSE